MLHAIGSRKAHGRLEDEARHTHEIERPKGIQSEASPIAVVTRVVSTGVYLILHRPCAAARQCPTSLCAGLALAHQHHALFVGVGGAL